MTLLEAVTGKFTNTSAASPEMDLITGCFIRLTCSCSSLIIAYYRQWVIMDVMTRIRHCRRPTILHIIPLVPLSMTCSSFNISAIINYKYSVIQIAVQSYE